MIRRKVKITHQYPNSCLERHTADLRLISEFFLLFWSVNFIVCMVRCILEYEISEGYKDEERMKGTIIRNRILNKTTQISEKLKSEAKSSYHLIQHSFWIIFMVRNQSGLIKVSNFEIASQPKLNFFPEICGTISFNLAQVPSGESKA